jgi:hypothetical protein
VLVGPGEQECAAAFLTLPAGKDVRGNFCVSVADVGGVVYVKNGRRDIKRLSRWAHARHGYKLNRAGLAIPV